MDIAPKLRELARNLWWTWQPDTIALFRDLDPALWRRVNHNPVAFLAQLSPETLVQRAVDLALEARISFGFHRLHEYLHSEQTWGDSFAGSLKASPVAYFSAEFGLHESLPIYSGGLGVLAGDHLKGASDLGLPIVGVGLFYAQGYFNQRLDADGWQKESFSETPVDLLPLDRVKDAEGKPVRIRLETPSGEIWVGLRQARVGRATLLLLDSDVEENSEEDRKLTGRLYKADPGVRIRQELILGMGGIRALALLGIRPGVVHLNEGHSAFALLEMARAEMITDEVDFPEAFRRVKAKTVFTSHTPVEAGHDRFDGDLIEEALGSLRESLGLSREEMMALGRLDPSDEEETFCLTVLGLKAARMANGVSALHGRATRRMWGALWPGRDEFDVPIRHITNGVHIATWLSPPMHRLYNRYLGRDWEENKSSPEGWQKIDEIEDGELWEAHQINKARLVSYVQRKVLEQFTHLGGAPGGGDKPGQRLDPSFLTIGFARRFTAYKRADLILGDEARLERLVADPERPIQILFAGKAHPKDEPGKRLVQRIVEMSLDPRFQGRILFLEDYDINVARHLVQGVDLWLNTPRRPLEASGTSGMKAVCNGVLHLSMLDGWWAEAFDGSNGFAIGDGSEHSKAEVQDRRDTESLYAVLEEQVIPLFYDRDAGGIPRAWVGTMKKTIKSLVWRFSADRMLKQYAREFYLPIVGGI